MTNSVMAHQASTSGVTVVRKCPIVSSIGATAAAIAAAICARASPPSSRASSAVMTTSAPWRNAGTMRSPRSDEPNSVSLTR